MEELNINKVRKYCEPYLFVECDGMTVEVKEV